MLFTLQGHDTSDEPFLAAHPFPSHDAMPWGKIGRLQSAAPEGELGGLQSAAPEGELEGLQSAAPEEELGGLQSAAPEGELGGLQSAAQQSAAPEGELAGLQQAAPEVELGGLQATFPAWELGGPEPKRKRGRPRGSNGPVFGPKRKRGRPRKCLGGELERKRDRALRNPEEGSREPPASVPEEAQGGPKSRRKQMQPQRAAQEEDMDQPHEFEDVEPPAGMWSLEPIPHQNLQQDELPRQGGNNDAPTSSVTSGGNSDQQQDAHLWPAPTAEENCKRTASDFYRAAAAVPPAHATTAAYAVHAAPPAPPAPPAHAVHAAPPSPPAPTAPDACTAYWMRIASENEMLRNEKMEVEKQKMELEYDLRFTRETREQAAEILRLQGVIAGFRATQQQAAMPGMRLPTAAPTEPGAQAAAV